MLKFLPALRGNQAVYLEIGMKAGARLVYQLLEEDKPKEPEKSGGSER